jgi:sulfur-oxidizing protein SoxX
MRKLRGRRIAARAMFAVVFTGSLATAGAREELPPAAAGEALAFDVEKGNCLACHQITGGEQGGNIGPALSHIKQRYPDKEMLRALIYDASRTNPNSVMPPFGRHAILTREELNQVVEFIYTQ